MSHLHSVPNVALVINTHGTSHAATIDFIGAPIGAPNVSSTIVKIHLMITLSKVGIFKPKAFSATKHPLPSSIEFVPSTYLQASKHAKWRTAMQAEFNALLFIGTWVLVPPSPNQNVVGYKWVFQIKKHHDGSIDRYKAQLIAKGFY